MGIGKTNIIHTLLSPFYGIYLFVIKIFLFCIANILTILNHILKRGDFKMNKIKYLFSICFVSVFVCCMGISVKAEETEIDTSVFRYEENEDGTITIIGYSGTDETVIVPSEIDGKSVTVIGDHSFYNCDTIKHLVVKEGIVKLGNYSFTDCDNLKTVLLPKGLSSMGNNTFYDCISLTDINIPNTVQNIEYRTFNGCISLVSINIPSGVQIIDDYAFRYCTSLKNINIPDTIQRIGEGTFIFCKSLEKIIIPENVIEIGEDAFFKSFHDYTIIIANSDSYARKYANQNEIKFSCLNEHDWDAGIITIKPTLISEGQKTFTCTACKIIKKQKISKLDIPKKGENITDPKTENSFNVTNPAIQNGTVELININVNKSTITIPDSITVDGANYKVTSVSKNVFKNNKRIKKIIIGKSIKSIGSNAFSGCKNLKKIIIKSKQIKTVGKNAFKGINPKANIKVPKKKLEFYQNLFAKKGQKSTVKIIK